MAEYECKEAKKTRIIEELYELDEDDYVDVICKTLPDLSKQKIVKIKNLIVNKRLMLGDTMDQGTGLISSPRIDLVYRGDLIPTKGLVFIDVEKFNIRETHEMAAGTVAIVDSRRELIVWSIIKQERICQFFPKLTARTLIKKVCKGNTVVRAAVEADLTSIGYDWKTNDTFIADIQLFFRDSKGPFRLADLAKHFYPAKADYQCAIHSAIGDARMSVKVAK
ncbi:unnamed protein product [Allacma fusca]|uniref:Uncharacterized protein n=1 Tax=Allacma fusca TaxID=39272 RepID=A0A8J2KV73_9HEXA|nr:unnamed protein product [Allacma fusca]